jgi:hypothetical protein
MRISSSPLGPEEARQKFAALQETRRLLELEEVTLGHKGVGTHISKDYQTRARTPLLSSGG